TVHDLPLQLPAQNYDDFVHLIIEVYSGPSDSDLIGLDTVAFSHDVTVPTIDQNSVQATNTYDGQLDQLCVVSDCDVVSFELTTSESQPCTCRGFPCQRTCPISGET